MRHKSALSERPGSHCGSYTTPKSNDLPFSGWIGKPERAAPEKIVCTWVLPVERGSPNAELAVYESNELNMPVKSSTVFGARNTLLSVPRSSRSSIGRYSTASFQLLVLPNVLYFDQRSPSVTLRLCTNGRSLRIGTKPST